MGANPRCDQGCMVVDPPGPRRVSFHSTAFGGAQARVPPRLTAFDTLCSDPINVRFTHVYLTALILGCILQLIPQCNTMFIARWYAGISCSFLSFQRKFLLRKTALATFVSQRKESKRTKERKTQAIQSYICR